MDIYINNTNNNFDNTTITKMSFIFNAINDGWCIHKEINEFNEEKYIFRKKHENKKEIFSNNYLEKFINKNLQIKI